MKHSFKKHVKEGFTLIEMLLVVMLLGTILAFIAPKLIRKIKQAGEAKIKFKMASIKEGITEFRMEFDRFPTTKEGLNALVENPHPNDEHFAKKNDKWPFVNKQSIEVDETGTEFIYNCPPVVHKEYKNFEIIYLGPSGQEDDPEACHDGV
jgi:general secretion pathway protein G